MRGALSVDGRRKLLPLDCVPTTRLGVMSEECNVGLCAESIAPSSTCAQLQSIFILTMLTLPSVFRHATRSSPRSRTGTGSPSACRHFLDQRRGYPVPALPHRGVLFDATKQLVFFVGQHGGRVPWAVGWRHGHPGAGVRVECEDVILGDAQQLVVVPRDYLKIVLNHLAPAPGCP